MGFESDDRHAKRDPTAPTTRRVWDLLRRKSLPPAMALLLLPAGQGCEDADQPQAVYLSTGTGPAQVVYPRAIDHRPADDSFVIIDRMARVQRITADGKYITSWPMPANAKGKPVGVSVSPAGDIWVPDTHYHRVIVYSPDGREKLRFGELGKGPGQFIFPTDIAFDEAGLVYVAEYGDHDRIQVFDAAGTYLREFGRFGSGDGEFNRPQSILIRGQELFVADSSNHRIAVFSLDGTWLRNLGGPGGAMGEFRFPFGLTLDRQDMLIVTEFGNNRVQRIDPQTGKSRGTWGRAGRQVGEFAYPWDSAVDARGRVATLDSGNNRLQVFRK
jgi:DNA-binding beta-propeller fold protein YncE